MPDDTRRANGSVVGDLLSVTTLLENPQLAGLYRRFEATASGLDPEAIHGRRVVASPIDASTA